MGFPYSYQDAQAQPKGEKIFSSMFPWDIPGMTKNLVLAPIARG